MGSIVNYINNEKALQIIAGILLSVFIAFTLGALVQWVTRLWLSFNFLNRSNVANALFGGVALASISNFILIKGIKGTAFSEASYSFTQGLSLVDFMEANTLLVALIAFFIWFLISLGLLLMRLNLYQVIIAAGTFSLALAFAGNDLVNFIGVPIAAYQSYELWTASGMLASDYNMSVLANSVKTPTLFLLASGAVMVLTLWFSKKARYVADTEINLAREGE